MNKLKLILLPVLLGLALTSAYADQNTAFNLKSTIPNLNLSCAEAGHFTACNQAVVEVDEYWNQLKSEVAISNSTGTLCTVQMHDETVGGHGQSVSFEAFDHIAAAPGYACYVDTVHKTLYLTKL